MNKAERDKETWHFRGREARGQNKPREFPNGRVSVADRQHFYEGWDKEDQIRSPKPAPEAVAEFNGFLSTLAAEVRASLP